MQSLPGSAALLLDLQGAFFTITMRAFGDPERVRKAMAAACSHRHSIIITHGPEYAANVIAQLGKLALDNVGVFPGKRFPKVTGSAIWNYQLTLEGKNHIPHLRYHSQGKDATFCPLFQFLRIHHRREWVLTPARKKNPGGRPKERWLRNDMWKKISNLTEAQRARYERLAKARAAKAGKRIQEQQSTTKEHNGITLGLKHTGRRIIPVDFSKMHTATGAYDQDAEFNEVWEDSLTPAERAEGPGA